MIRPSAGLWHQAQRRGSGRPMAAASGTAAQGEQRHFRGGDSNSRISRGTFSMVWFWSKSKACSLR